MIQHRIYLDYQASTPMDPRAVDAMLPYFSETFGNPHANHHSFGADAEQAIVRARAQVAALIGADPSDIVFTSGATEANNLALRGVAPMLRGAGRKHVVVSAVEHTCTLAVAAHLETEGFTVTRVPVDSTGRVNVNALAEVVSADTGLVSVMTVNNEIGTVQPVRDIARLCADRGALFHTDAAQAAGKVSLDVKALGADLVSLSAHKLYGPKGIGALYVHTSVRRRMAPLIRGGGQEGGLRSGTLPTPLCVGFGAACEVASSSLNVEAEQLAGLRDRFLGRLERAGIRFVINGTMEHRIPGNLNLAFAGIDAEALLMSLREHVAISTGSACTTGRLEPSHVLRALGISDEQAEASIRVGFGRFTTSEEIDVAADLIAAGIARLLRVSYKAPVYAHA